MLRNDSHVPIVASPLHLIVQFIIPPALHDGMRAYSHLIKTRCNARTTGVGIEGELWMGIDASLEVPRKHQTSPIDNTDQPQWLVFTPKRGVLTSVTV